MITRIGTILPGKKLDPWLPGMERYLPDDADVIIVGSVAQSYGVQTLDEWHAGQKHCWWVHKDNIRVKESLQ